MTDIPADAHPSIFGLFDRIEFGIAARCTNMGSDVLDTMRHRLNYRGFLVSNGTPDKVECQIPIDFKETGCRARVSITLPFGRPQDPDGDWKIAPSGSIRLNLQRLLRAEHGISEDPATKSLDGRFNYLGLPTATRPPGDPDRQIALCARAVENVIAVLRAAVPLEADFGLGELRLRTAELSHDIACPDASRVVRLLERCPVPGAREIGKFRYQKVSDKPAGTVVHWQTGRAYEGKAYAKAADLLRVEVVCSNRDAVAALLGERPTGPVEGQEAARQLRLFADAAIETLAELHAHATEVRDVAPARPFALRCAFEPLAAFAAGQPLAGGRHPSQATYERAQAAYDDLIETGLFRASGTDSGTPIRRVLDQLAAAGTLRREGRRPITYYLAPAYAAAALAFAPDAHHAGTPPAETRNWSRVRG